MRAGVMTATGGRGVTARAYPNIALVKYWGKRDEKWMLPVTGSLSMTLDLFPTTTRVELVPDAATDVVRFNGGSAEDVTADRIRRFLEVVRALAGRSAHAIVESVNTVPTAAGLASSAAGFAALAVAAASVYGLCLDGRALSRLARRGSGSACRSVFGGFVQWHAGLAEGRMGDKTSYAEPVPVGALDPALVITVVDPGPKRVPSRQAMRHTQATSPLYGAWARAGEADLGELRRALRQGDLDRAGMIAERNALGMHASMLAARPAIRYLTGGSLAVLDRVARLREQGVPAHATIDAGPNVAVLCPRQDAAGVAQELGAIGDVQSVHIAGPGPAATVCGGEDR